MATKKSLQAIINKLSPEAQKAHKKMNIPIFFIDNEGNEIPFYPYKKQYKNYPKSTPKKKNKKESTWYPDRCKPTT